ncbi:hypothetical protein PSACC_00068 [Paramicrosporidium saccamoebae]|uniref:Uncharacterized protein n=1 Tax=Paramicrosporidium saccamoebae TaxID=1246581 RepID=A0A2H9TQU9_9FUNG|nr:hypothetical protein PSACC_00068 [Paramicrosporidium saccamoebae]
MSGAAGTTPGCYPMYHQTVIDCRERAKCPLCRASLRTIVNLFLDGPPGGVVLEDAILEETALDGTVERGEESINESMHASMHESTESEDELESMRLDLEEAEAEIEALEENLRVAMTQLHRLTEERASHEDSLQGALAGMQQTLFAATQRWDKERKSLEREVIGAKMAKEDVTRLLEEKESKLMQLGRELEELQSVRLSREMERVLTDLNETRTKEHLESLKAWSKHDLISHCSLLTINGRRQETYIYTGIMIFRDLEKMGKELRKAKIELELAERQLRKLSHNQSIQQIEKNIQSERNVQSGRNIQSERNIQNLSTNIGPVPMKRKILLEESSLITIPQPVGHTVLEDTSTLVTPRAINRTTSIAIPPKFTTTRLNSTVADGCGGTKKVIHFPDRRL